MDGCEFANLMMSGVTYFGILNQEDAVKKLRELANRIEKADSPRMALQQAHVIHSAKIDDFLMTTLVLQFAELSERAARGTQLHAGGSPVPIEVKP